MAVVKIGIGLSLGAQVNGAQYGPLVAETWIKKFDVMIMQDRSLGNNDYYLHVVKDVVEKLQTTSQAVLDQGDFPLVIGGDHDLAMGSLPYKEDTLLVWADAHGDVNTFDSSITHRIHGMPLAHLMGYGDQRLLDIINKPYLTPEQIVFVGVRDLDDAEVAFIKEHKLMMIDHHQSTETIVDALLEKASHFKHIHLSFDLDSLDPRFAPGVSTPVADGMRVDQALRIIDQLFQTQKVRSMDIVEFNPLKETQYTVKILSQIVDLVNQYKA